MRVTSSRTATPEKLPLTTPSVVQLASSCARLMLVLSTPNLTQHQEQGTACTWSSGSSHMQTNTRHGQKHGQMHEDGPLGTAQEWFALSEAQNMTDATSLLRRLCDALHGRARWRPNSQRVAHKFHACAAQPVQLVWRSPSPPEVGNGEDGMAWCSACIQPGMAEHAWASLPEHMIASTLREQAYSIRQGRDDFEFDARQSHFGACPLCGMGEAGAEHIWQWCAAAIMTWAKCGDGTSWREVLAGRCSDRLRLAVVASQIVFLYTALFDRACITADDSVRRITKAVRAIVSLDDRHSGHDDGSGDDSPQVEVDTWSPLSECARCNRGERNLCRITCRRQHLLSNRRTNEDIQVGATVASRISVNEGRIMATFYADNNPARWMTASAT